MTLDHVVLMGDHFTIDGGASAVMHRSAVALSDRGMGVTVLAGEGEAGDRNDHIQIVNTERRPAGKDFAARLWNPAARSSVKGVLADLNPARTIVHLHTWTKSLSSSVLSLLVRSDFPVVVTLHDYFSVCPNGGLFDYQQGQHCGRTPCGLSCILANCDSRSRVHKVHRLARHAGQVLSGFFSHVDGVIYVSEESRAIIEGIRGPACPTATVTTPTFLERPAERVAAELNSVALAIGRASPEKGVMDFARASAKYDGSLQFVFLGAGTQLADMRAESEFLVAPGWTEGAEKLSWIRRARCIVFPSLWHETFGLVVDEAASQGVPAVVADTNVAAARVARSGSGLLYPAGDVESLCDRLRLLESAATTRQLSKAAWSAGASVKSPSEFAAELHAFYLRARRHSRVRRAESNG